MYVVLSSNLPSTILTPSVEINIFLEKLSRRISSFIVVDSNGIWGSR